MVTLTVRSPVSPIAQLSDPVVGTKSLSSSSAVSLPVSYETDTGKTEGVTSDTKKSNVVVPLLPSVWTTSLITSAGLMTSPIVAAVTAASRAAPEYVPRTVAIVVPPAATLVRASEISPCMTFSTRTICSINARSVVTSRSRTAALPAAISSAAPSITSVVNVRPVRKARPSINDPTVASSERSIKASTSTILEAISV